MLTLIKGLLFVSALLLASVSDIRSRTLPIASYILLTLAGLIFFSPANLFGLVLAAPFFFASGYNGGGAGDVKLIAAASLSLGFYNGARGLFLAVVLFAIFAAVHHLILRIRGCKSFPVSYPLAPFLSIGYIAVYFIYTGGYVL